MPLEVLVMIVLESEPRLLDVISVTVWGVAPLFVIMFCQRAKESLLGTKTFLDTVRCPDRLGVEYDLAAAGAC